MEQEFNAITPYTTEQDATAVAQWPHITSSGAAANVHRNPA